MLPSINVIIDELHNIVMSANNPEPIIGTYSVILLYIMSYICTLLTKTYIERPKKKDEGKNKRREC